MQLAFDHLVWFAKKPEEMLIPLKQKGIHAVNGGRHESWGTYNSLAYFGLSYIEFLGIENFPIAEKHEENKLVTQIATQLPTENGEGPARIAVRTNQIGELAKRLKKAGLAVYGPIPGERVRADGQTIRWSLLFPENAADELSLPFFIQWEKPDEERLSELKEQDLIGTHYIGNPQFESVSFVVHNLNETINKWSKLFNLEQSEAFIDPILNARCKKLELAGTKLLFCTPLGEGPAAKVLNEKGEAPFLVNLTETTQNILFKMANGYWRFHSVPVTTGKKEN